MRAISFIFFLFLSFATQAEQGREATVEPQSSKEVVWIDVRSRFENKLDSIEGDPNIPHGDIVEGVTKQYPNKNTPIRLYCAKGGRAGKAHDELINLGYLDIINVGGIADVRKMRAADLQDPEPVN